MTREDSWRRHAKAIYLEASSDLGHLLVRGARTEAAEAVSWLRQAAGSDERSHFQ